MKKAEILVVDDESGVRDLVGDVLGLEGYQVTIAVDGLDALSHIRKQKFDLFVLDINMPGMDGWEFAAKLRRHREYDSLRIIIMPSAGIRGDAGRCKELRIEGYLTKRSTPAGDALAIEGIRCFGAGVVTQARSSKPISMACPASVRLQRSRHGASQIRPRMPGKGMVFRSTFQATWQSPRAI